MRAPSLTKRLSTERIGNDETEETRYGKISVLKHCVVLVSLIAAVVAPTAACGIAAQSKGGGSPWAPLSFLIGEWTGEGSGKPGQGPGEMSVSWDLNHHILLNKGHSAYPASKDRPATVHDSVMIIYLDPPTEKLRASYFDNEGHVIQYAVETGASPNRVVFLSDASPATPRFRLSYIDTGNGTFSNKFEIAPPGKPEAFSTYIEGKARRK